MKKEWKGVSATVSDDNVCLIELNRPKELNSFTPFLYANLTHALNYAAEREDVVVTVLTGLGPYFSSGHALNIDPKDLRKPDQGEANPLLEKLKQEGTVATGTVNALIDFPKLLIAAVNGPAIGISVTLVSLCDIIYVSEKASFTTPFMQWGFSPEGCSSITFPRMMGNSNANEVLLLGSTIDAQESVRRFFASRVFKDDELMPKVMQIAKRAARSSPIALLKSKKLIRDHNRDELKQVAVKEMKLLIERMASDESVARVTAFIKSRAAASSKSKL